VRNYSLSAVPSDREYRISVKRERHGVVSTYLHTRLKVGDSVEVAASRGEFVLPDAAADAADTTPVLLLSAGVGATPVMAMLHALTAAGSSRDVWWLHSARSAAEHAFAAEAHRLLGGLSRSHEHVYYTAPARGVEPPIVPGRLTRETLAALDLPTSATAYLCGPGPFMDAMCAALIDLGLASDRIHTEVFGTLAAINPGLTGTASTPPHEPPGPAGTGPKITFIRSGLTVPWREDYSSVLDFAEACDVPTRWSCRTGVCHTCRTAVLSGKVRYRPDPLEPPDPGTALVCCARPEPGTDLVLDL
jgi:ferredoxin-NADP reductase/ferredoxin